MRDKRSLKAALEDLLGFVLSSFKGEGTFPLCSSCGGNCPNREDSFDVKLVSPHFQVPL